MGYDQPHRRRVYCAGFLCASALVLTVCLAPPALSATGLAASSEAAWPEAAFSGAVIPLADDLSSSSLWDRVALPDYAPSELTWRAQVRTEGGYFRVYRAGAGGEAALVEEIAAHPDSQIYRFRDSACFEGRCVYELAYVLPSGQELSLGAVRRDGVRSHQEGTPNALGFGLAVVLSALPAVLQVPAPGACLEATFTAPTMPRREPRVPPPNAAV